MGKFTMTHEINCNEETFWKTFLDKDFNEKLYREALGFPSFNVVEQNETDTQVIRKAKGEPKMDMPGPVMKLIGSSFSYIEEGNFDKKTKVWRWKMIPSTLADKVRNEGMVRVEPIGSDKVRRIAEVDLEAKIFGIGGLLESSGEKQLREGWDQSAVFMNQYVKK